MYPLSGYAGRAILTKERGMTIPPFRYHDKGVMATIGRNAAVASAFGMNSRGALPGRFGCYCTSTT